MSQMWRSQLKRFEGRELVHPGYLHTYRRRPILPTKLASSSRCCSVLLFSEMPAAAEGEEGSLLPSQEYTLVLEGMLTTALSPPVMVTRNFMPERRYRQRGNSH